MSHEIKPEESGTEPLCQRGCPALRTLGGKFFCREGNRGTEPSALCVPKLLSVYRCASAITQRRCGNCVHGKETAIDGVRVCARDDEVFGGGRRDANDYCRLGWEERK